MTRRVFFSFHFEPDSWRVAKVRQIGAIEGDALLSDNDWEAVKRGGPAAIEAWISGQLKGTSCVVVLIGSETSSRKWVIHEIEKGWNSGKGVVGIHIHNIWDRNNQTSSKGANPLSKLHFVKSLKLLSTVAKTYDPPGTTSADVYGYISDHIEEWVEEDISIHNTYTE